MTLNPFRTGPRTQRSGLLFILLTKDIDGNYEVASVLGGHGPGPGDSRGDADWCEASLRECGTDLLFDEVPAEVAGAQSILVTGHMVGEDFDEYDEHFDLVSVRRVTAWAEVRRATAPMLTLRLTEVSQLAYQQPGCLKALLQLDPSRDP